MYILKNINVYLGRITRSVRSYSKLVSYPQTTSMTEFSLDNYDVIGFDLDHTICKYNLNSLFTLIYNSLAQYLVKTFDYPSSLLESQITAPIWAQKGLILDKARGNLLKLDKNFKCIQAYHGTRKMTEEDISETYGTEHLWDVCKTIPQTIISDSYFQEPYYIFRDHFTSAGAVLCSKIVDLIDKSGCQPSTYSFFEHYINAVQHIYNRRNFKDNTGYYYPMLRSSPHLYVEKCSPEFKVWLKNLKKEKKVFLLTGSNADIANYLATLCLGSDWKDYFDIIVTYAKKPGFFIKSTPFYAVKDYQEAQPISFDELRHTGIYSQGNLAGFNQFCSTLSGRDAPKVLYVGDSVLEDVYAASCFAGWDTVAIVEEILAEVNGKENHLLNSSNAWGSYFGAQKSEETVQTFWSSIISEHSKIAIPDLNTLSSLDMKDKVPSFTSASPFAGYFPLRLPDLC